MTFSPILEEPDFSRAETLPQQPPGPAAGSLAGWTTASICFLLLGFVLPILVTPLSFRQLADPEVALPTLILLYAATRLSFLLLVGREYLVQATFWIFVYVFFGLAAVAQTAAQRFALPPYTPFADSTQINASLVIAAGLLAYEVGRFVAKLRRQGAVAKGGLGLVLLPRRIWALGALGLAVTAFYIFSQGIPAQFQSRQAVSLEFLGRPPEGLRPDQIQDKAIALVQLSLRWLPIFLSLFLLLTLRASLRGASRQVPWITTTAARALLLLLIVGNIFANNPLSNPRYRFGGGAIALVLAVYPFQSPRRFRLGVIGILFALLFVFPLADAFRYDQPDFTTSPIKRDLTDSPDFSMFQQELNAQLYVQEHGHTLGRQALGAALGFVPRRWWTTKPIATGDLVSRTSRINASLSLWGEAYVDGGYVVVFVVFGAYGWLCYIFEHAYVERKRGTTSAVGIFVPLFAAFQLFVLRGSLQPAVGDLAPLAVLVLLCSRATRDTESHLDQLADPDQAGAVA